MMMVNYKLIFSPIEAPCSHWKISGYAEHSSVMMPPVLSVSPNSLWDLQRYFITIYGRMAFVASTLAGVASWLVVDTDPKGI